MQAGQDIVRWFTRCSVCGKQFEVALRAGTPPWVPAHLAPGFGHPCLGMQRVPAGAWRQHDGADDAGTEEAPEHLNG